MLVAIAHIYNGWWRKSHVARERSSHASSSTTLGHGNGNGEAGEVGEQDLAIDEQMALQMFQWAKKIYGINQLAQNKCQV